MVMGVSNRMLRLYYLALRSPDGAQSLLRSFTAEQSSRRTSHSYMATLATNFEEETKYRGSKEEYEDNKDGEVINDDEEEEKDDPAVLVQKKPAWAPCFFCRLNKEVYSYVGHEIIIEEGLDSYAGMIWPAALALCHYLDTHREQINLVDKAVLEIGAGTGLVSIVATLLGAWVTATDLPVVLANLQVNLNRNTRGRCRYTPQVATLSWGYDLECTYPKSVYRYDYVLCADVVYHHDFLDELFVTMKHFCKPGTTLIWANKVRFGTDLTFTENFKKAFQTSLLAEDGEMKIFMATFKEEEEEGGVGVEIPNLLKEKEEDEAEHHHVNTEKCDDGETEEHHVLRPDRREDQEDKNKLKSHEEEEMETVMVLKDEGYEEEERDKTERDDSSCSSASDEDFTGDANIKPGVVRQYTTQAWVSRNKHRFDRDVYHYVGQDILIHESMDSFGAVMWPAALALCSFLDNNRERVNLQGKEVLELGAGTGLVSIVASLLGASVTATDLPEILGNLQANIIRNTRGCCRYTPQVATLSWGYDLERTYPKSRYHYDYVLCADIVYHHDFLDELLVTMKHFCRPGTTLIWANKVRFGTDLTFTENFKKAFQTSLLVEDGEMKIFTATCRK
ncbi:uncharacterized protein LOC117810453 [Notolabrus celidotus]|uniref:uncharacterized protein LOC117810453 n=1 Tax=Notolabrus celidotus TaxID=1203425 RepID=UPI0014903344|nr:uncharacterized protein LOC117810453 [Notolabrus celidotus]